MPGLDDQCTDPCYEAGRLFAIYGDMQYAAATMGGGTAPNSTFADKYLAGAISDPRTAITAGEKQAAAWLNKLRRGEKAYFFQRDLDAVMALLQPSAPLPTRASLDEQAMFILGYHHQRAHSSAARTAAAQWADGAGSLWRLPARPGRRAAQSGCRWRQRALLGKLKVE